MNKEKKRRVQMGAYIAILGVCCAGLAWGYNYKLNEAQAKRDKLVAISESVKEMEEKTLNDRVEYEIYKVEGNTYFGVSEELDRRGMHKGIEFGRQLVVKEVNIGDKVVGYWQGNKLKGVILKEV